MYKNSMSTSPILKKAKLAASATSSSIALFWFRSDLRLADNTALAHCLRNSSTSKTPVVALYLLSQDEWLMHDIAPVKVDLILRSLQILRKDLKEKMGIPLVVVTVPSVLTASEPRDESKRPFVGQTASSVASLCQQWNVTSLFANKEYEVDEMRRDEMVKSKLLDLGISATFLDDQCVVEPGKCFTKEGKPYTVFTPFKNTWLNIINGDPKRYLDDRSHSLAAQTWPSDLIEEMKGLGKIPEAMSASAFPLPKNIDHIRSLWPAGESEARERLERFANNSSRISGYNDSRNIPSDIEGTSRLSPYLSLGMVSARECIRMAKTKKGTGVDTWISELCWRDFYRHVLFHFPRVGKNQPFKESFKKVKWQDDDKGFEAWKNGKTGFPIVDAAMRELQETGYMHNRCRMITAMFLTKDLLIDWRKGEQFFMKHLIDGDFASNNGGWQWSASTGTDAQPYFRIFNPLSQSQKVDPNGVYIRRHLNELSGLSDNKRIHEPSVHDCVKFNYPKPIVKHDEARKRAIAAFQAVKNESS